MLERDGKVALFLNMGGMSESVLKAADIRGIRIFGSSANISGTGNSFSLDEVPTSILESTDLICDAGRCKYASSERTATTIVELDTGETVRAGILYREIKELLTRPAV
jgi:tRNA A37 threonylcarbamoyladenosine synthetase subunit TsaC/SUA5/YrdC